MDWEESVLSLKRNGFFVLYFFLSGDAYLSLLMNISTCDLGFWDENMREREREREERNEGRGEGMNCFLDIIYKMVNGIIGKLPECFKINHTVRLDNYSAGA